MNEKIIVALIAAGVSILTTFIFKPIADRLFHIFKLKQNYKNEQRKKIKNVLAENKGKLLKSAEDLNSRLWNLLMNESKKWHVVNGDYKNSDHYYIQSFVYRILVFYGNIKILEDRLIFFDGQISTKEDLRMIKFFRLFHECFCNVELFKDFRYDNDFAHDHLFKNLLKQTVDKIFNDKQEIISFDDFINKSSTEDIFDCVYAFIDGISPNEERFRWLRLFILHLTLIAFLNTYGYDFQHTVREKIYDLFYKHAKHCDHHKLNTTMKNFEKILMQYKMNKQIEFKTLFKEFNKMPASHEKSNK